MVLHVFILILALFDNEIYYINTPTTEIKYNSLYRIKKSTTQYNAMKWKENNRGRRVSPLAEVSSNLKKKYLNKLDIT